MDAAFWSARRVTFAGSITPALTKSPNSPASALKPKFSSFDSRTRPTTNAPSCPAFWAIWRMGSSSARFTMFTPMASSSWSLSFSRAGKQRRRAVPPPETMPSSTCRTGSVHGVLDASLFLLQLCFGCRPHLDYRDAASQRGLGLGIGLFSDDQQRVAHLGRLFERRQHVLHRADLLFVDQDVHVLEHAFHALWVGHKVGREVSAVKLHAFDYFEGRLHRLGFLDGDDAILAHLLHRFGDDAAHLLVGVGADCADLRDHVALNLTGEPLDLSHGDFHRLIDAALERHRARACGNRSYALTEDCLCQHGRGGGAIASHIRRLGRNLADHLCTHVLERVLQLDLLCYRHPVFRDDGCPELLLDHRIAPLRAKRHLYSVHQNIDAAQNRMT